MKKLMWVVAVFGVVSSSLASASVEYGEKTAKQMNGRMLACGRPAKLKTSDALRDLESRPVASSSSRSRSASAR